MLDLKLPQKQLKPGELHELWGDRPPAAVVGKRDGKQEGRVYEGRSLSCMRPSTLPRRGCIWLVETKAFDFFILATILCKYATRTPRGLGLELVGLGFEPQTSRPQAGMQTAPGSLLLTRASLALDSCSC